MGGRAMDEAAVLDTLKAERTAALVRVRALHCDLDGIVSDSVNANADDEHDPEGPTGAYERAQVTALITRAQSTLSDLDHALARLSAGSYSVCESCGVQIPPERLAAPTCSADLFWLRQRRRRRPGLTLLAVPTKECSRVTRRVTARRTGVIESGGSSLRERRRDQSLAAIRRRSGWMRRRVPTP
jgi:DnaK suppressor protein